MGDARPQAWFETGRIAARDEERARIAAWLEGHLAAHPELVVKDPRLSWFLGLWRVAAERAEARPVVATMLRPPAEVAGSRAKYYNNKLGAAHLVASWVNMLLHTELATRDTDGSSCGTPTCSTTGCAPPSTSAAPSTCATSSTPSSEQVRDGHRFIDPSLRRITATLDELDLPPRLREITEDTWTELDALVEPGRRHRRRRRETLDQLTAAYVDLYAESEAISRSTVVAATARAGGGVPGGTVDRGGPAAGGATAGGPGAARAARGDPTEPAAWSASGLGQQR